MLRITVITLLCLCFFSLHSQQIRPLAIGDHFPAMGNTAALNHVDSVIDLSDFSNQLLILDFWATWCTACIGAFPKIDSLQQVFKEDIKIVLINVSDPAEKINSFLTRYEEKRGAPLGLPTVWGRMDFFTLLTHRSIPHYAWIFNGRLIATTGPDEVNTDNIRSVLNKETVRFRMKKDILDYDKDRPLLENGNGGDSAAFSFKSFFAGELPGMKSGYFSKQTSTHRRNAYINFSVARLFSVVSGLPPYLILLNTPDAAVYSGPDKPLYSYELTAPAGTSDSSMTELGLPDLSRYLNVSVSIQKKRIPVYRLVMSEKRKRAPKDTVASSMRYNEDNTVLTFNATKIRFVVHHLNTGPTEFPARRPFVDETGYEGPVTVAVPSAARSDIELLRKALAMDGIRIKSGRKKMTVCVINRIAGNNRK